MKSVRFKDPAGSVRIGRWTDDAIVSDVEKYGVDEVDVLPPVAPGKVVGMMGNYREHVVETGAPMPERPMLFFKGGPNIVSGHRDTVKLLDGIESIQYEVELGIVIDEQCRNLSRDEVDDVIRGYTVVNDLSNRDDQFRDQDYTVASMCRGKCFDNSLPVGPVLASPDEVPEDPRLKLWVNGELEQDSDEDERIYSPAEGIEEITKYITLEPDDLVIMGTPIGPGDLRDGDTVEAWVEGVGTLIHHVER